jgi:hypothetical protein
MSRVLKEAEQPSVTDEYQCWELRLLSDGDTGWGARVFVALVDEQTGCLCLKAMMMHALYPSGEFPERKRCLGRATIRYCGAMMPGAEFCRCNLTVMDASLQDQAQTGQVGNPEL